MSELADTLFKKVYQDTGSIEVAILELKRLGWSQSQTVTVVTNVFEVSIDYARVVVANSVAWQK